MTNTTNTPVLKTQVYEQYYTNIANFFGDKGAKLDGVYSDVKTALEGILLKNNKTRMQATLARPVFTIPANKRNEALAKNKTVKTTLLLDTFDLLSASMLKAHAYAVENKNNLLNRQSYVMTMQNEFIALFEARQAHYVALKNETTQKAKDTKAQNAIVEKAKQAQAIEAQAIEAQAIASDTLRISELLKGITAGDKESLKMAQLFTNALNAYETEKAQKAQQAKAQKAHKAQAKAQKLAGDALRFATNKELNAQAIAQSIAA